MIELLTLMYLYNNLAVVIEFYVNLVNYLSGPLFRPVNVLDPVNCVYRHIVFQLHINRCGLWVLGRAKAISEFFRLVRGNDARLNKLRLVVLKDVQVQRGFLSYHGVFLA